VKHYEIFVFIYFIYYALANDCNQKYLTLIKVILGV
jgi:hypothetical protein